MAVLAGCEWYLVLRVLALGYVALTACHRGMLAEQRIRGFGMVLDREARLFKAPLLVAGLAIATIRTPGELSFVRVLVAIHAACESNWGFKVVGLMACLASHFSVFAKQRKAGLAMIEAYAFDQLPPSTSRMTLLAGSGEGSAMGVLVTGDAVFEEYEVLVEHRAVFLRAAPMMTLYAFNSGVQTRQ